jgi:hypothetical protein
MSRLEFIGCYGRNADDLLWGIEKVRWAAQRWAAMQRRHHLGYGWTTSRAGATAQGQCKGPLTRGWAGWWTHNAHARRKNGSHNTLGGPICIFPNTAKSHTSKAGYKHAKAITIDIRNTQGNPTKTSQSQIHIFRCQTDFTQVSSY